MFGHTKHFLRLSDKARRQIRHIAPIQVTEMVEQGAVLLDVREKEEFDAGHVRGAMHLSSDALERKIHYVVEDRARTIVCYCAGDARGALAVRALQDLGYIDVYSVRGGLMALRRIEAESAKQSFQTPAQGGGSTR